MYDKGDKACVPLARSISSLRRMLFNRRCESQLILVEAPGPDDVQPKAKENVLERSFTSPLIPPSPTKRALLECVGAPAPTLRVEGYYGNFTFEDHEAFRRAFVYFDTNGDGKLNAEGVVEVLSRFGVSATEEEVSLMLETLDFNGRGHIGFGEFLEAMKGASISAGGSNEAGAGESALSEAAQRRVFDSLDEDGDGFLTRDDVRKLWQLLDDGESAATKAEAVAAANEVAEALADGIEVADATSLNPKEQPNEDRVRMDEENELVERMLAFADLDGDGKLSFPEFMRVLEHPPETWL